MNSIRLVLPLLLLAFSCGAYPATIEGKAIKVVDGDSITILNAQKQSFLIRIHGIDAPEKAQPWGDRARQNMVRMVAGKDVTAECHKTDPYGRPVCKVWVTPDDCAPCEKTLDVGHAQIVVGLAWWYRQYAKEQSPNDRVRYQSGEAEAKAGAAGLWRDPNPTPPWEWRRTARRNN